MGVSRVEDHQPQAQSIKADVIADRRRVDPFCIVSERVAVRRRPIKGGSQS